MDDSDRRKDQFFVVLQRDGNFVEYNRAWKYLWSTQKFGQPDYLKISDHGAITIFDVAGGILWSNKQDD